MLSSTLGEIPSEANEINSCPLGCLSCSKWNGCLECAANFTWHMEKPFLRSIGVCLRECPAGYFKREFQYAPGYYRCVGKLNNKYDIVQKESLCDYSVGPHLHCILQCAELNQ